MRLGPTPVLLSLTTVVALGVGYGLATDRWGASDELSQALGGLGRVPATFGDWVGEDVPFEAEDMARVGIKGSVFRRYRHVRTGEVVSFLLVCGRGGPISVHTPDVCYAGAGYRQVADERKKSVESGEDRKEEFWVARFGKRGGVVPTQLEVYWAWSRDGRTWQAPENPRLTLARSAALYKLYVVREFVPETRFETKDSCQEFLRRALPVIRQSLPPDDQ
jgi:hypothetical protein